MSTPNFKTMKDFPLIIARDNYAKQCHNCGMFCDTSSEVCDDCGASLADAALKPDYVADTMVAQEMQQTADRINEGLMFHEVTVESGNYSGAQFLVKELYDDIDEMSNEYTKYQFDMCKSKAKRRYEAEKRKIVRELRKLKQCGYEELECVAIFSNGEAIYEKVA